MTVTVKNNYPRRIYDAVHGFIRFNEIERAVIDSAPFQRLHHIHQLGIAFLVFPGATHSRFEHSLGAMELASQIFERLLQHEIVPETPDYWRQVIRLAALCHDMGHLPFSHDAEEEILGAKGSGSAGHEAWTYRAIRSPELQTIWQKLQVLFPMRQVETDILRMAIGERKLSLIDSTIAFSPWERVLSQVVTGDFFGSDRIDYLLRDATCTGVSHGLFDYQQLIETLRILPVGESLELGIEEDGMASCEALLLARHFMHRRVYQYSNVKAHKFHLARFMLHFYGAGEYTSSLEEYLSLSDAEILSALKIASRDAEHPGHLDALSLLRREKRFRALALDATLPLQPLSALAAQHAIGPQHIAWDLASSKQKKHTLSFPVQKRSGHIVNASDCSQISVPQLSISWVYVAPQHEELLKEGLKEWLL